jgi:hypothetical protein
MAFYFDSFPKREYDINGKRLAQYTFVTDIMFRINIIRSVLSNVSAYYEYLINDTDTPEILADKLYGSAEAHWMILLANDMVDPQYDWPLNSDAFQRYIIAKYGSVETAKITAHHHEKVITREESYSGMITESRYIVNESKLTVNDLDVPYDYYDNLPETQGVSTYNMGDGQTVVEIVRREVVTKYDYEDQLNEAKRPIKLIKKEYYGQILNEFNSLTKNSNMPWLRSPRIMG